MLDPATLALLAKLKVLGKQSGINIDLIKMSHDKPYAEQTLKELSNADDPELVLIVVQLMNLFGMIKAPAAGKNGGTDEGNDRYVGALR